MRGPAPSPLVTVVALAAALAACADGEPCEAGEHLVCEGVDNCLCGPSCSDDSQCLANQVCAVNVVDERACVARAFRDRTAPECASGQRATEALCGGDVCSCADPCSAAEDCRSLCCVEGRCALPCACESEASVEVIVCNGA